jgi:hypothetical protein
MSLLAACWPGIALTLSAYGLVALLVLGVLRGRCL